jgi:Xaa-Pro dipeptidase
MSQSKMSRVSKLAQVAKVRNLDWVLCMLPENIFYFSGFRTMLYTKFIGVLIPVKEDSEAVLIASAVDERLVRGKIWSPHWFKKTLLWGVERGYEHKTPWDALKTCLVPGARLGVDAIQYNFYRQLLQHFPGIEVEDLQNAILELRSQKDDEEIKKVGEAYKLAMKIMARIPEWLQEPMTESKLAAKVNFMASTEGTDGSLFPTLVSCGEKILATHSPPLPLPLEPHKLIRVALGLQLNGYGSDIIRTYCIGQPPQEIVPIKDAFFEAQEAVINMIRPGVTTADLLAKVREIYKKRGCIDNWRNLIGHGLGLTIHEPPTLSGDDRTMIRENMILAIEPGLRCPPHGAFAHCDGVKVTAGGCERLSGGLMDLVTV